MLDAVLGEVGVEVDFGFVDNLEVGLDYNGFELLGRQVEAHV